MSFKNILKNKSIYMIIIFSLIIFTFSMCSSIFTSKIRNIKELNGIADGENIFFQFEKTDGITFDNIIAEVEKYKSLYLEYNPVPMYLTNSTVFGKAIYFNYKLNNTPPLLEGRYISQNDFENKAPTVVIGKDVVELTTEVDGDRYLKIEDTMFKVVGTIGYKDKKSSYDNQFIFNMMALNYKNDKRAQWKIVSTKGQVHSILEQISKNLDNNIIEIKPIYDVKLSDILHEMQDFIKILITVSVIGVINILIFTSLWADKYKKEIGIRKALGATSVNISIAIFTQYIFIVMISAIFATILHLIVKNVLDKIFPYLSFNFSTLNLISITIVALVIGIITSIFPIKRSLKLPPAISMKGGK